MSHQIYDLAGFQDYSVWTALSNDTTNLATSTARLSPAGAITFDKANGTGDKTYAGVYQTVDLDFTSGALSHICSEDRLVFSFYVGATTNVASLTLHLGSSLTVCRTWTIADTSMTSSSWQSLSCKWGTNTIAGAGWTPAAVTYMAVAFNFDGETNALAGLILDRVYLMKNTATVS